MKSAKLGASLIALLAFGCAQSGPIEPPPVVDLGQRNDCAGRPNLGRAYIVAPDKDGKASVTAIVDQNAPCLEQSAGAKSLYAIFLLPPGIETGSIITVASSTLGGAVFAPHVVMLDSDGKPVRELERDKFQFRGSELSVLFRPHSGERYILAASDPSVVGKSFTQVSETTSSQMAATGTAAGPVYFNIYTGRDVSGEYVYAHSGVITLSVVPAPETKANH